MKFILIIFIFSLIFVNCYGQNKWIWPKTKNQKVLAYYPEAPKKVYYADELNARSDREREPTTRKPLPGETANDEIEDYPDNSDNSAKIPERQNSPYPGNFGGQFGGGYPQFAGGASGYPAGGNGILTGPGGPTGIIGRPQSQFPAGGFPGQGGFSGFPSYNNAQPYGGAASNPNFPNFNGIIGQPYFPGQQQPSGFPNTNQQFPGSFSPQYTEGYGFSPNFPQQNFAIFPGGYSGGGAYPGGFDEYPSQATAGTRIKSANVKMNQKKIDDKVSKNLKN